MRMEYVCNLPRPFSRAVFGACARGACLRKVNSLSPGGKRLSLEHAFVASPVKQAEVLSALDGPAAIQPKLVLRLHILRSLVVFGCLRLFSRRPALLPVFCCVLFLLFYVVHALTKRAWLWWPGCLVQYLHIVVSGSLLLFFCRRRGCRCIAQYDSRKVLRLMSGVGMTSLF